jgi:hypothetical protein
VYHLADCRVYKDGATLVLMDAQLFLSIEVMTNLHMVLEEDLQVQ